MKVTSDHIDAVYDATTTMRLFSQILCHGEIDDVKAGEMSWLLGSAKKKLDPIISLLERIQFDQEEAAGDSDLSIADEIEALERKLAKLKGGRA